LCAAERTERAGARRAAPRCSELSADEEGRFNFPKKFHPPIGHHESANSRRANESPCGDNDDDELKAKRGAAQLRAAIRGLSQSISSRQHPDGNDYQLFDEKYRDTL